MKLLTKSSILFITANLFVFFAGGIVFYFILKSMTDEEVNSELLANLYSVTHTLRKTEKENRNNLMFPYDLDIQELHNLPDTKKQAFTDTVLYNELTGKYQPFRKLTAVIPIDGNFYQISVYKSLMQLNALVEKIILIITFMVILFIITTLYFNRLIYRSIWSDFFYSLEKVSHFQLSDPTGLNLPRSEIEEFSKLNAVLEKMSRKLSDDYYTLKDFTANVSHEIQTPLAIIKSKVELLFQSEQMNEKDMMLIQNVYQSINRLSRIVNTLGILAKIENQQYIEKKRVDFFGKINYHLSNLNDLYESRQIRTSVDKNSDLCISINPYLADVMIINLLKNAFIHNHERGQIRVVIDKNRLIFLNTGPALAKPGKDIFNRFVRGDQQKESLGLGLALVKEICQLNNISINYRYINKIHTMELNFFKQKF